MPIRQYMRDFLRGKTQEKTLACPIAKTSFAGTCYKKEWLDQVTWKECFTALSECGVIPSIIVGEKEYFAKGHPLAFDFKDVAERDGNRILSATIQTEAGELVFEETLVKKQMAVLTKNLLQNERGLEKVLCYLDAVMAAKDDVVENLRSIRREVTEDCLIQFFVPQPFELYCLIGREEAIYLKYDEDEQFGKVKDKILETVLCLMDAVGDSGLADFFLFGSAGTELYSPQMFDEEFFESSRKIIAKAKEKAVPIIYHACGNMRYLFEQSRLLELEPDIFEGLAFSPAGDLEERHLDMVSDKIVIRGNLNLALLRDGTPAEIQSELRRLKERYPNKRFLFSGSCDTLYGTPRENVRALKGE